MWINHHYKYIHIYYIFYIYTYFPSLLSLPPASCLTPLGDQRAKLGSLYYTAASCSLLSILHIIVHICQCSCLSLPYPLFPLLYPQVHSLLQHLHYFSANKFISIIFLDSIHTCWYTIFVFFFSFWLTLLCIAGSRLLHITTIDPISFLPMT